jgi:clan AA aspartic protease
MGLTTIKMEVANPAKPKKTITLEFLVDSGVIYSVVPEKILKKLGIKPVSKEIFTLANSEQIKRKKGVALFKFQGKIGGADVIFGEKNDSILLGAFTLEALGLALDPLKRELKPIPLIIA